MYNYVHIHIYIYIHTFYTYIRDQTGYLLGDSCSMLLALRSSSRSDPPGVVWAKEDLYSNSFLHLPFFARQAEIRLLQLDIKHASGKLPVLRVKP